ncbi:MAG TPA: uracil-DNA glycosylase, partial [Xanthobacteraceae bacterium]|nr:uracil-DNA glycosylase [Xanthobacteraceae bacterium]
MTPDHIRAARELLAFYAEAGVDALLGEEPVDRLSAAQLESAPAAADSRAELPRPAPAPR